MNNFVYILLGANQGDTRQTFAKARDMIEKKAGEILSLSSLYQTQPWGFNSDDTFLNQAMMINTRLDPETLLKILLQIEKGLGRIRHGTHYTSRIMDIDILFYNNEMIDKETLTVPHPRMHLRNFALVPMTELAPEFVHPQLKKTMKELKRSCSDKHEVVLDEDQQVITDSL